MSGYSEQERLIGRREAIRRVSAVLGGIALVGESALLAGCRDRDTPSGDVRFTEEDIAFLDEVAETILPQTSTPGAKAAKTGAFMALMVTDTYDEREQQVFREGMQKLDEACEKMHDVGFMEATPQQRLALLQQLDREQKAYADRTEAARKARTGSGRPAETGTDTATADAYLTDQRQENAAGSGSNPAAGLSADAPPHYFRMMKELALLGYFTSEIGYTQAMRYVESPGRFEPCAPYAPGEKAWAPHA